jgi:hypothetical protein
MKITKREYTKQMNELTSLIASTNLAIDFTMVKIGVRQFTNDEAENINGLYDKIAEYERAIKDLDDRWQRRNWTGNDYSTYALIVQNID